MFNNNPFSLKKSVPLLVILLFIFSCNDEIKPLEFKTINFDGKFEADIEISYDEAKENSDVAKTINKNIKAAVLDAIPLSESKPTIELGVKAFDQDYKTFKSEFPESDQAWALSIETEILYKAKNIITMGLSTYADAGGAHGNGAIQFLNFNPETGNLYKNEDLFNDIEGFKTLAETYFLDHMKNEGSEITEFFFGKDFQLPENIGFNEEGIILLYNVYEIAAYTQGYTEFVIPIEKAQKFLKI